MILSLVSSRCLAFKSLSRISRLETSFPRSCLGGRYWMSEYVFGMPFRCSSCRSLWGNPRYRSGLLPAIGGGKVGGCLECSASERSSRERHCKCECAEKARLCPRSSSAALRSGLAWSTLSSSRRRLQFCCDRLPVCMPAPEVYILWSMHALKICKIKRSWQGPFNVFKQFLREFPLKRRQQEGDYRI